MKQMSVCGSHRTFLVTNLQFIHFSLHFLFTYFATEYSIIVGYLHVCYGEYIDVDGWNMCCFIMKYKYILA